MLPGNIINETMMRKINMLDPTGLPPYNLVVGRSVCEVCGRIIAPGMSLRSGFALL